LCEALGDDHDLYLVLQALRREDQSHPARDYRKLSKRITAKRDDLQACSFKLGKRIFNQKPGAFAHNLERWLRSAKQ
jgi:hypothetical protein